MSETDLAVPLAALALGSLLLTGCAGKSTPSATASTASSVAPGATSSAGAPAVDQTIALTYAGGKVSGASPKVKVRRNSTVALVVTSDVADEVHLHGYDKMADVAKGGTVTIVFRATLTGEFEVELEKLGHRLVILQVQ